MGDAQDFSAVAAVVREPHAQGGVHTPGGKLPDLLPAVRAQRSLGEVFPDPNPRGCHAGRVTSRGSRIHYRSNTRLERSSTEGPSEGGLSRPSSAVLPGRRRSIGPPFAAIALFDGEGAKKSCERSSNRAAMKTNALAALLNLGMAALLAPTTNAGTSVQISIGLPLPWPVITCTVPSPPPPPPPVLVAPALLSCPPPAVVVPGPVVVGPPPLIVARPCTPGFYRVVAVAPAPPRPKGRVRWASPHHYHTSGRPHVAYHGR